MKALTFLENDYKCPSSDDSIMYGKMALRRHFDLPSDRIESMEIIYQFHLLGNDEAYKIVFDKERILVTYSVYVQGSDYSTFFFLEMAARNDVKEIIYLDTSGSIVDFLNRRLRNEKEAFAISCGVNSNYILTTDRSDEDYGSIKRVMIKPAGIYDDCVSLEPIDFKELL